MNVDNFLVRPKRRIVERFSASEAWTKLGDEDYAALAKDVAGLPSQKTDDDVDAKRFDLLMLRLQLALLRSEPGYERLRDQVRDIVSLLEEKGAIPMVATQMDLINAMVTEDWWQDVTLPMLEASRKRLRLLIKFIDKTKRKVVYTNFEDQLGTEVVVSLPQLSSGADYERFRAKARQFLRTHEDHVAMRRLKRNVALTSSDLLELERMLLESGVGSADDIARAKSEGKGLGYFIRSLVGLDREAAKEALGQFVAGTNATANQVEFISLVVDYLTEHGVMDPGLLYESPLTSDEKSELRNLSAQLKKELGRQSRVRWRRRFEERPLLRRSKHVRSAPRFIVVRTHTRPRKVTTLLKQNPDSFASVYRSMA